MSGKQAGAATCPSVGSPLQAMVDAENAFAQAARTSVRRAFLDNLAGDAWVLQPGPVAGRPLYEARPESAARLEWYPHVAAVAASGDLGFSSGPYTYSANGTQTFGHYLSLWRVGPGCRWQVVFDGGISHPKQPGEPAVDAQVPPTAAPAGPQPADLVSDFESVAGREGLGAALRTYARNAGFLLLLDGQPPMELGQGEKQVRRRIIKGDWREAVHGASADASLSYVVGSVERGAFVQIWLYDARTANWGLRVLLITGA